MFIEPEKEGDPFEVFTDPQIAIVGGGHRALPKEGYVVGQVSFEDQGRSRVMLKNRGLLEFPRPCKPLGPAVGSTISLQLAKLQRQPLLHTLVR